MTTVDPTAASAASAGADGAPAAGELDTGLVRVLKDDGSTFHEPRLPASELLRAYRELRRLRAIDARTITLQRQGRVGFYGAAARGKRPCPSRPVSRSSAATGSFPRCASRASCSSRGFPLEPFIAQVFGNAGDVLKGRQMPSHHSGRSVNQVSWSSCIGPHIPQAVGAAWAMKLRAAKGGGKDVAVGFMGDGRRASPTSTRG